MRNPQLLFLSITIALLLCSDSVYAQVKFKDLSVKATQLKKSADRIESKVMRNVRIDPKEKKITYSVPDPKDASKIVKKELAIKDIPKELTPSNSYTFKDVETKDDLVILKNPQLEVVTKWKESQNNFRDERYKHLAETLESIPNDAIALSKEHRADLQDSILNAISITPDTEKQKQNDLVDLFYHNKSYSGDDQILFSVFEKARESCLSAIAIRAKGMPKPRGSGVLIGNNTVLTCWHCISEVQDKEKGCEVLLNYTVPNNESAYEIDKLIFKSEKLDFCLITTKTPGGNPVNPARLGLRPELIVNEGIYVAGYPRGNPLSVALNGKINFPYWLSRKAEVDKIYQRSLFDAFSNETEYNENIETIRGKFKTFFDQSYLDKGADGFFFCPHGSPTIGADPDTKVGDSGGPVFDIKRNALIGILRGAQSNSDDSDVAHANPAFFEWIVPISEIAKELDTNVPNWKTIYGVSSF